MWKLYLKKSQLEELIILGDLLLKIHYTDFLISQGSTLHPEMTDEI